uniref:Histone-arginine methyltransferase CARM1 n=1 Tax=Caenorhabditis tropicalis TaxID=1561998 RepID=A0A1I7T0L0_9PELO
MTQNNLRFVDAVVCQFSDTSGAFYAYSHHYPTDIIIDQCYCPEDVSLVGKWIEVGVDHRTRARDIVRVIDDKFPTRVIKGHVEIKVEVEHDGRTADNLEMFFNRTFGYICDPNNVLYDVRKGVNYHIWIIRFKRDRLASRWRVSTEQENIQPYFPKPAFRISFQHTKRYKQEFEMFYHHYFGDISDSLHVLDSVEDGSWYTGWIVYSQHNESNTCWRLAIKQLVLGPFKRSADLGSENLRHMHNTFPEQALSRTSRRRSRSIEKRNSFDDVEINMNRSHHRFSSPDVINEYNRNPSGGNDEWSDKTRIMENSGLQFYDSSEDIHTRNAQLDYENTRHRNYSPDRRNSYNSSTGESFYNYSKNCNYSSTLDGKEKSSRGNRMSYDRVNGTNTDDDFHDSTKRIESRHKNERRIPESTDSQTEFSESSSDKNESFVLNRKLEESPTHKDIKSGKHADHTSQEVSKTPKVPKEKQEKEIRLLKLKLFQISQLVLSLTADDSVSIPMKLWSVEEYEDLMKLAKTYGQPTS